MGTIRVSDKLRMFIEHPHLGRIGIPIDRVEVETEGHYRPKTLVYFKKNNEDCHCRAKNEDMCLDISLAMTLIEEHVKGNNEGAENRAKERGFDNLDRYVVKDMCVEEILWVGDSSARLYCTWADCYGGRRLYYGQECYVEAYGSKNKLYMRGDTPTFYF